MPQGAGTSDLCAVERNAIVICLARAHDQGHTTIVFCLSEHESDNYGPFRLRNHCGRYVWPNQHLRDHGIKVGSIISYERVDDDCLYTGSTGREVDVGEVLPQLPFARIYHSIKDAFPDAQIAVRGLYQENRPYPPYALISVSNAFTFDGRIVFATRLDEKVNLSNRCLKNPSNTIEVSKLSKEVLKSKEDIGDVVLVGFGSIPTDFGRFQAMCEGIILKPVQVPPRLVSYSMRRKPRGLCLIINNLEFKEKRLNRYGGEFDEELLHNLFLELSFEVHVKQDLKCSEILEAAEEYASRDHSNFDAFFMIVMSHGADGDAIYGVSGKHKVRVEDFMADFQQCPTLNGKPKVFIIQACRGSLDERELPISFNNGHMPDALASDSTLACTVSPPGADFLLAFSTMPGYVSWRNEKSGSLYIKVFVEVIKKYREHSHLLDMLTEVNRQVVERVSNEPGGKQQIPAPVSTLMAQLYLKDL